MNGEGQIKNSPDINFRILSKPGTYADLFISGMLFDASPFFSVVIPTYNRVALLRRALSSVQQQTFADWECLIYDDGSSDDTRDFVSALAAQDKRFQLLTGARYGLPAAPRNRGIEAARGAWVAFLDDDDVWHPRKLERQREIIETQPCDVVSVQSVPFVDEAAPVVFPSLEWGTTTRVLQLSETLIKGSVATTPATAVRRELLSEIGGFVEDYAYRAVEDYDLWCRLLAFPGVCWQMDEGSPLALFRLDGSDSISTSQNKRIAPDILRQRWANVEIKLRHWVVARVALKDYAADFYRYLADFLWHIAGSCRSAGLSSSAGSGYFLCAVYAAQARNFPQSLAALRHGGAARLQKPAVVQADKDVVAIQTLIAHSRAATRSILTRR